MFVHVDPNVPYHLQSDALQKRVTFTGKAIYLSSVTMWENNKPQDSSIWRIIANVLK